VAAGAGFGFAGLRARAAVGFARDRGGFPPAVALPLVFARAAFARLDGAAFARAVVDDLRFSLRCPGRDLGRLPSTPGSSLLSAATREK
jgi:hypothetical protein